LYWENESFQSGNKYFEIKLEKAAGKRILVEEGWEGPQ